MRTWEVLMSTVTRIVNGTGQSILVPPAGIMVGRGPSHADVVINHRSVHRRHALIFLSPMGPTLLALGKNPLFRNRQPVPHIKDHLRLWRPLLCPGAVRGSR